MRVFVSRPWRTLPIAGLALLTLALPSGAQEPAAEPPMDYIAQADKLSQPIYPETAREKFEIESFDGETIYVEVVRPDPELHGDGPWPVVMEASPYHGTIADRDGIRIFPDPRDEKGNQIGLTGYFAPRGYAVAIMDLRGTGRSSGCLDHLGPKDAKDLKIVIEWLASQPWSNGRVGMTGHSYVGSTPSIAAAQRPKGLVTIAPSAGLASMYDHQFQRGVPYLLQWVGPMFAYEYLAMERDFPPGTPDPLFGGNTGDNWEEHGPNPQFGCGWQNSSLTAGSGQVTGQYELWHARRDWREGAADADIPVFMIHGVNDNAARIPAAEWFFGGRYLRPGDKVWLGQWNHGSGGLSSCADSRNRQISHVNCRFDQWQYALHAWFDHHLQQRTWVDDQGVEHPIDTGPPVEVFLNGQKVTDPQDPIHPPEKGGVVFTADTWRRYPRVELFPDATDGSLGFAEPPEAGSASFTTTFNGAFFHQAESVEFVSEPLSEGAVFVGLPRLNLHASVSEAEMVHVVATLYREDPTGAREPMNYCAIQPMLRHGVETPAPVIPGEEMTLPLQCFTAGHWVPAGHRLVLEVGTQSPHHASFGGRSTVTVYTGPGESSYLLPRVPEAVLHPDVPLQAT